jgi:hypothetical protein
MKWMHGAAARHSHLLRNYLCYWTIYRFDTETS